MLSRVRTGPADGISGRRSANKKPMARQQLSRSHTKTTPRPEHPKMLAASIGASKPTAASENPRNPAVLGRSSLGTSSPTATADAEV